MGETPAELTLDQVFRECDTSAFTFETTDGLPALDEIIGQPRAVSAVEFSMGVADPGYNLFAVGPPGTGKASVVSKFLNDQAASMPVPDDWVYVHNFAEPSRPNVIRLPAGRGQEFRKYMEDLVEELKLDITQAFDSEEYANERQALVRGFEERAKGELQSLTEKAEAEGLLIISSPAGVMVLPKMPDGKPMQPDQYEALPEDERTGIEERTGRVNDEMQQVSRAVRRVEREGREAMRDLDRRVTTFAARHIIDDACEHWCTAPGVNDFLYRMLDDVVENADDFKKQPEEESVPTLFGMRLGSAEGGDGFRKYKVNVVVDNSACKGAPVIGETNPVLQNLVGRIEHLAQFGALTTDFNMIKAGALHKANGGFLVLDARELLTKPYAWDALKRALKSREIRVEDIAKQMGFATTAMLDPQPIPFAGKVVLIGEPFLHHLLAASDPDFAELFKIKADFDSVVERTPETEMLYARFIAHVCRERDLAPFSAEGVGRVIEHCSRLVSDQKRSTTRFRDVADLATEASYWAVKDAGDGKAVVDAAQVQKAIDQHTYRSNMVEQRLHDMIRERSLLVDVTGAVPGQVNALSVTSVADYMFGIPSRITATHRLGDGEVVDIEREVEMGGPIHSKGVLILAGYLGSKYASDCPLSLTARLVFEQNYSGVEGDSASSTELYALLSSLSGVPIQQRFAVTGSVNQLGRIQAIGGVNDKIEGFFKVCRELDPDGDHAVLIPQANVRNLMLDGPVREAIAAGRFHIYPVSTVDEGISLLTGVPAGEQDEHGTYPEGSVNRLVVDRLAALAKEAEKLGVRRARALTERREQ